MLHFIEHSCLFSALPGVLQFSIVNHHTIMYLTSCAHILIVVHCLLLIHTPKQRKNPLNTCSDITQHYKYTTNTLEPIHSAINGDNKEHTENEQKSCMCDYASHRSKFSPFPFVLSVSFSFFGFSAGAKCRNCNKRGNITDITSVCIFMPP